MSQIYETRVSDEFVMVGNDVLVKCLLPSFVSDNVIVEGWITSEGVEVAQSLKNIGKISTKQCPGNGIFDDYSPFNLTACNSNSGSIKNLF